MTLRRLITALSITTALTPACAEVLHDIRPLSTLADIKKQYPNATFKKETVAWVKEWQAFYSMKGSGFPGELYLIFYDHRPQWREEYRRLLADPTASQEEKKKPYIEMTRQVAEGGDDISLTIDWVRWIPADPIPMTRVKAKYGQPTRCDFTPDDFRPYCSWPSRELITMTTEDHKHVLFFTAHFTAAEMREAYKAKGWPVPDEYKAKPSTK